MHSITRVIANRVLLSRTLWRRGLTAAFAVTRSSGCGDIEAAVTKRPRLSIILGLCLAAVAGQAWADGVGFQVLRAPDLKGAPINVAVWYPSVESGAPQPIGPFEQTVAPSAPLKAGRLPLIIMSHGTASWYGSQFDTAWALARAGFIVAALTHTGDNLDDQSQSTRIPERPRQLHVAIEYLIKAWTEKDHIDRENMGVFGYSSGGLTALIAIGGTPDLSKFSKHCLDHPAFFDCGLLRVYGLSGLSPGPGEEWVHDKRLKAAVIVAPALGFLFRPDGLKTVRIPIQLWRAAEDHILPNPDYAEAVRRALPTEPDYHVVAGADHLDFTAPCTQRLAAAHSPLCAELDGFDRAAFHLEFNKAVTAFFIRQLKQPAV